MRSYISTIKTVLKENKIKIDQDEFLMASLIHTCRFKNDRIMKRIPIQKGVLSLVLNEISARYSKQPYLQCMYRALLSTTYFGLLRISKVTSSTHVIKACDVQVGQNKKKLRLIIRSSKTHWTYDKPQRVKISSKVLTKTNKARPVLSNCLPCPYALLQKYIYHRGPFKRNTDQLFVFSDGSPIKPGHARGCLKTLLKNIGLNAKYCSIHCLRSGRALDLLKSGVSVETIKKIGRWRSNAVFRYLK